MLKYKADRRTLAFICFYFCLTIFLWKAFALLPWYMNVISIIVLCFSSFICAITVHNTIHSPIFTSRFLNSCFQFIQSFTYGHAVSGFVAGHNFSHHKYLASTKDIARTTKLRFKWNLLNQLLFFSWTTGDILRTEYQWGAKMYREKRAWFYQYSFELLMVYGIKIGLLFIDYKLALLLVFLPHQFAQWAIIGTNYWQHDGCDTSHPYNHSRNFTNPILNFFFLNNGFHGLHHNNPSLHWSLLPSTYQTEYLPHIHPNLNRNSLLAYLFESCIYPGKRVDYLGKPIVLPPKEKDENWVTSVHTKEYQADLGAITFSKP